MMRCGGRRVKTPNLLRCALAGTPGLPLAWLVSSLADRFAARKTLVDGRQGNAQWVPASTMGAGASAQQVVQQLGQRPTVDALRKRGGACYIKSELHAKHAGPKSY